MTDADLDKLDVDELLNELVERVRGLLNADTVAVLLLDESGTELVATAAAGLEEEVDQGVRIPMGKGFAGRIAAERRPVIIDRVDHTTVLNPILRAKAIRSLLGVPLISQGRVIGVLHIGTLSHRRFNDDDVELLRTVADRVAATTEARLVMAERTTARVLQRSLLPSALPSLPHLTFSGRYVPGERGAVGGDWYDTFTLPSGHICVAIGDVVGRGLQAAVVMGRVRSVLRGFAIESTDPGEVLSRLDRQLQHFEPTQMTTLLYGVFDRTFAHISLSSAGHPPPILALPNAPSRPLEIPPDPPLGVPAPRPRQTTKVAVPVGGLLCFYTDGLVERRDASIEVGIGLLSRTVGAGDPVQECAAVMGALVGDTPPSDDIALLMVKREMATSPRPTGDDAQQPEVERRTEERARQGSLPDLSNGGSSADERGGGISDQDPTAQRMAAQ